MERDQGFRRFKGFFEFLQKRNAEVERGKARFLQQVARRQGVDSAAVWRSQECLRTELGILYFEVHDPTGFGCDFAGRRIAMVGEKSCEWRCSERQAMELHGVGIAIRSQ